MPAVAMTDHGNLFGAVKFYNAAKAGGVHPVIGCEVYVSQQSHKTRSETDRYNHLVLLCEDQDGYRNLINLVSTGYLEGFYYKPRIDMDLLAAHSKGLIAMSACLRGHIPETILADKYDDAQRLAYTYSDIFGANNFFLEVQDHHLEQDKRLTPQLNRLSHETGLPLVATNDSHYLRREDARAHEILLCIQTGKTIYRPQPDALEHARLLPKIARRNDAAFRRAGRRARPHRRNRRSAATSSWKRCKEPFPKFDVPESHSADTYFEYVARQGFEKRRPRLEAMRAKGGLKHDLAGIRRAPGSRNPHDPEDEVLRLLPDRLGFHPLCQGARHSRRARTRLRGRQPGGLRHGHHRYRPAAIRPAVRALPQSRSASACPISTSISA